MRRVLLLLSVCTALPGRADTVHIKHAVAAYEAGAAAARHLQFTDAIERFRKAIEIEPTFRDAFEALIGACLKAGQRTAAAAAATQLLQIEPDLVEPRLLLGQIVSEENQPQRALAQFSFVLKSDPSNADALLGFAGAAKRMGMDDRAADAIEKGKKRYPLDKRFH